MAENDDKIYQYQPLWNKWYIELPIGKGSFGRVYKIVRNDPGGSYVAAVKIISIPNDEQYREARASFGNDAVTLRSYFQGIVQNIVNEINLLYTLGGNTNIIGYQDHEVIEREDKSGWDILIRMEYVTPLTKYIESMTITKEDVLRIGMDICTALELCSKKGIIHRDIKDENIFVNEDGVFKLGDFGISRELSADGKAGTRTGTPIYMAPEIYNGEEYNAAVDIYSMGIVLYKLLNNGRIPFLDPHSQKISVNDNDNALHRRMQGDALPFPVNAGEALGRVILKASAFKPENRYASAIEMKRDLGQVLANMSEEARKETVTQSSVVKMAEQQSSFQKQKQGSGTISIFDGVEVESTSEGKETIGIIQESSKEANHIDERADEKEKNAAADILPKRFSAHRPSQSERRPHHKIWWKWVALAGALIMVGGMLFWIIQNQLNSSVTPVTAAVNEELITTAPPESSNPSAQTSPRANDASMPPIRQFFFSDQTGFRTWWDVFWYTYQIKIESNYDPRIAAIISYNDLPSDYIPAAGETIYLPPLSFFTPV